LRLVVHIQKGADGRYAGTAESPDQGALGIPLGTVTLDGQTLAFEVPSIRASYRGTWQPAQNHWSGQWSQGGGQFLLDLARAKESAVSPTAPAIGGLDGDWDGTLEAGATRLRLVFHIQTTATGTIATMDSVDQGANGIPISSVSRSGETVKLEVNAIGGVFEGNLAPDERTLNGHWTQGGGTLPMTLTRRAQGQTGPVLRRPQMPAKPYPYAEEEVSYENPAAHIRLAGTLTLPRGAGPFPAVILIAGSGPIDRDETLFGHKFFLVLADHLTRHGIAVLRVDKRGIDRSTGNYADATSADFADDVQAGIAYLKTRPEIEARKIGLAGHSEGGVIAPIVAARDPSVAFIVLMAGLGMKGDELLLEQNRLLAKAMGADDAQIEQVSAINRRAFTAAKTAKDSAEAAARLREILSTAGKAIGMTDAAVEAAIQQLSSNWFRFFLAYDPVPILREVKCPVLAINGSKDLQVPAKPNLEGIRQALAGNSNVDVKELPGLNHLFQKANTGAPSEYGEIEETFAPSALELISGWILKQSR
jgi:uncharacterized protein